MSQFEKEYARVIDNMGGVVGTNRASGYSNGVKFAVDQAIEVLRKEADHRTNVSVDYLKGWLAEQWHAETLKISAAARGRNDIWSSVDGNNIPGKDILYGTPISTKSAEIKYHKTPLDTAKSISRPAYDVSDKIVPKDQLEEVIESAKHFAQKNQGSRPEQASQYQDTANRAADHLEVDNAKSKPLSEVQAKQMAKDYKRDSEIDPNEHALNPESFVEWTDIASQSGQAALHAAILSAALLAAPHIISIFVSVR